MAQLENVCEKGEEDASMTGTVKIHVTEVSVLCFFSHIENILINKMYCLYLGNICIYITFHFFGKQPA